MLGQMRLRTACPDGCRMMSGFSSVRTVGMVRCAALFVALCAVAAALFSGCSSIPENATADSIRDFYLNEVGDPECAVVTESTIVGDPHRIFRVASLGKLYVHLALIRMARRGEIDLDKSVRSVSKFDLPIEYDKVTLRDLIDGKSGLPREFLNPWNPVAWHTALMCGLVGTHIYEGFDSREQFAPELTSHRTLSFLHAHERQYSNVGFALLVMCVEDETGRTIDDILQKELVIPLGMEDTSFCPVGEARNRLTVPCAGKLPWLYRRGSQVPEHRLGNALRGMGSVFSSAADVAKFINAYWEVVDAELSSRPIDDYADGEMCGMMNACRLKCGKVVLYRFGMIYGGNSFLAIDPKTRRFLGILRNVTSWPAEEDFDIAGMYFRDRRTQSPYMAATPPKESASGKGDM